MARQMTRACLVGIAILTLGMLFVSASTALAYTPMTSPHGGGYSACRQCHSTHGAPTVPDYRTKESCYRCHGDTSAEATDSAYTPINTQGLFYDYSGQTAGSKHRTTYMITNKQECTVCHTAHRKIEDFPQLVRVETGGGTYIYNTLADPIGAWMCFNCHGDDAAAMASAGGPGAYGSTAGDHNESGYGGSAHGTATIYANNTNPGIQCEVCHNKHASPTTKLIDYRSSNTTDADLYAGAALCTACHDSSSSEASVAAGYAAPFAWNDRDVTVEFARTSAHPTATAATGASTTCVNCHNTHFAAEGGSSAWVTSRAADPQDTQEAPADFTAFCLGCHRTTPPSATIATATLVPYTVRYSTVTAPYFTGWDKTLAGFEATASGHYTTSGVKALCENCHDPHGSNFARLAAWSRPTTATTLTAGSRENTSATASREQNLCYQCHGNRTTGKQASGARNVATALGQTYAHPVGTYTGRHSDTETASDLGGTNRHAECVDCHDPHVARMEGGSALHTEGSSTAGPALYGAYGVKPTFPVSNWGTPTVYAGERLSDSASDFEAYLCFKCHSGNTTQPSGQGDTALQFNPTNYSSHNVTGRSQGVKTSFAVKPTNSSTTQTVSWAFPTQGVFRSGWDKDAMMTCTSCHTNSTADAKGPHGSSAEWLIDPAYDRDWQTIGLYGSGTYGMGYPDGSGESDATDVICAKCHDLNGSGSNWSNPGHARGAHAIGHRDRKYCVNCHIKIPHGWKRPRLLGYNTDPAEYATTNNGGGSYPLNRIEVTNHTLSGGSVSWACTDCKTSGGKHAGSSYVPNPWP